MERTPPLFHQSSLKKVMLSGVASSCAARVHLELVENGTHMSIDGMRTDDKLLRDLRIGHTFCKQAQHLHLTLRQSNGIRSWRTGVWLRGYFGQRIQPLLNLRHSRMPHFSETG